MDIVTEKVDFYEDGKFTLIESPINFPLTCCMEEWTASINIAGYSRATVIGPEDEPYLTIWSMDNTKLDCDYPYFVEYNCLWEGRIIFFSNWHSVTHFINTHGFLLTNLLLDDILDTIKSLINDTNSKN